MTMSAILQEGWLPYILIALVAILPTNIWRWAGVILSTRLHEDSELFIWIKAVAIALVAGVIAQLILFPSGALTNVPLHIRIIAAVAGFAVWYAVGKKIYLGILVSQAVLIGGWWLFSP